MNNIESELIGIINTEGNINGDLNIGYEKILPKLQEKTATPIKAQQVIEPDINYDGLSKVNVKAIPNEYIVPTGTLNITSNNTYDVKNYENAYVNIATPEINLQNKSITIDSNTTTNITYDEGFDGLGDVSITTQVPIPENANLVVNSIRTKNIFGEYTIINGWISDTRLRVNSTSVERMAFINCEANTTYTISKSIVTSRFRVGEYTTIPTMTSSDQTFTIPTVTSNDSGTSITYTTSSTAKYLIIEYANTNSDSETTIENCLNSLQAEEGSTATAYSSYQALDLRPLSCSLGIRNSTYLTGVGYNSVFRYGDVCIVSFNYQLANNIPNNTALLSGLPHCKAERLVFIGSTGNNEYRFYIVGDTVYNDGAISTGGWLAANFVYPIGD